MCTTDNDRETIDVKALRDTLRASDQAAEARAQQQHEQTLSDIGWDQQQRKSPRADEGSVAGQSASSTL
jgi:hypothetical protein